MARAFEVCVQNETDLIKQGGLELLGNHDLESICIKVRVLIFSWTHL